MKTEISRDYWRNKAKELAEENEQLRKELGDCEKFRYTVFQRMRDVLDE